MSNTIIFEMVTASILPRRASGNSQISAQNTLLAVCVADDDTMYRILVSYI